MNANVCKVLKVNDNKSFVKPSKKIITMKNKDNIVV